MDLRTPAPSLRGRAGGEAVFLIYREQIMLPLLIEVNHPLVEDDVIVEGAYGESMLAPCETDVDALN